MRELQRGRLPWLLVAQAPAAVVLRAEIVLLSAFAFAAVPLAAEAGGLWLWLLPLAGIVQAGTATCLARMAAGTRRHALGHASATLAACFFGLVAVAPHLFPYRTLTVLSGSMVPTFDPGDLIVVTRETANDLRVGQVLTYQTPVGDRHVVSHRVVRIVSTGLRPVIVTKGDANTAADPWLARVDSSALWRYRFRLPLVGYLIAWLRSPWLRTLCVLVVPAALALLGILQVWKVQIPRPRWRAVARG